MAELERIVLPGVDDVAAEAAAATSRIAREAIARSRNAVLALTGGTAGVRTAGALASADLDWSGVDVYFGDERFLPAGDPERNDTQVDEVLFSRLDTGPTVHRWPYRDADAGMTDVDVAASALADVLEPGGTEPFFDVHLLGMGGEGHVNSIFPETPEVAEDTFTTLGVRDCPKPPPERVTFTLPAVRRARHVFFVVAGADKAEAVARVFAGDEEPTTLPAAGAYGLESTVFFLDEAAASQLD